MKLPPTKTDPEVVPTSTVDVGRKFVPVTVTVVGVAVPVNTNAGDTVMGPPGAGLFTATIAAVDVPPPGAALTAVRERLPVAAKSAAVRFAFTWLPLTNTVVRALPFTSITVVGTNPVPVTAIVGFAAVVVTVAGDTCVIVGAGLVTCRATVVPDPLLSVPLRAITESWPPLASCDAETVAVTSVALT